MAAGVATFTCPHFALGLRCEPIMAVAEQKDCLQGSYLNPQGSVVTSHFVGSLPAPQIQPGFFTGSVEW